MVRQTHREELAGGKYSRADGFFGGLPGGGEAAGCMKGGLPCMKCGACTWWAGLAARLARAGAGLAGRNASDEDAMR